MEVKEYIFILVPLTGVILSQLIKVCIESIKNKKFMIKRFLNGSGGFPSTHTTLICSLLFTIMYELGVFSVEFAIVLTFAVIVLYDAINVRRDVEKSNRLLNDTLLKDSTFKLKHDVGHTLVEVIGGIIFSLVIATIITSII